MTKKSILFCARDHFGQKPFFYFHDGKKFVFVSELQSLIKFPIIKKTLRGKNISSFLMQEAIKQIDKKKL